MHSKIFPVAYTTGDELPERKLSQFAHAVSKCIDGVDGCAVSPSTAIEIGTSNFESSKILYCRATGSIELSGDDAGIVWLYKDIVDQDYNIHPSNNHDLLMSGLTDVVIVWLGAIGDNAPPAGYRIRVRTNGTVGLDKTVAIFQETTGWTQTVQVGEIQPGTNKFASMEFIFDGTDWYTSSWCAYGDSTARPIR